MESHFKIFVYVLTKMNKHQQRFTTAKGFFMEKEFYSIIETSIIFGVHQNTIRNAVKKGFLIAIRIGNGKKSPYRISRKEIDAIHHSIIKELGEKKVAK